MLWVTIFLQPLEIRPKFNLGELTLTALNISLSDRSRLYMYTLVQKHKYDECELVCETM